MTDTFSLEINDTYTRICDLSVTDRRIELLSLGVRETAPLFLSSENDSVIKRQAEIIAELRDSLKIPKENVRVIVPDSTTYSQVTELPRLKEKELLSAIRYQADEFIPMPLSETNLDMEVLQENEEKDTSLLLIVASPKKLAEKIESTVLAAGLKPVSLENELSAVGRLFAEIIKPEADGTLVINFGLSSTSIYILEGSTSLLRLSRSINIGLNLFVKDISINMNWDDKKTKEALRAIGLADNGSYTLQDILSPLTDELFTEISKLITLAKDRHGIEVNKLYMCNFDSAVAHFSEQIQKKFGIQTQRVDLGTHLVQNQVSKAFAKDISSFISVISANIT